VKSGKFFSLGSETEDGNAMFSNTLVPMARRETEFTKKLFNYMEDQCEEGVHLLVIL
jgi:hypothetical protein